MRYISLGNRSVSVIGLGAWQFQNPGWGWGTEFGSEDTHAIVRRAVDLGINVIDTAESYSNGESEKMVGDAIRSIRDRVLLATKVSGSHVTKNGVVRAAEESLQRLGTDVIDLFQIHWYNNLIPSEWTMDGIRELQARGLVNAVGVSNYSVDHWREAEIALGGTVISNQLPFNLLTRFVEGGQLPYAQANGRVIMAYSPIAMGMLSGKYTAENLPSGARDDNPIFTRENVERVKPLLDVLKEVSLSHHVQPAQIALAWLVRQQNVIAIPGAKSVAQIEENAAAAEIDLKEGEVEALNEASKLVKLAGPPRYVPLSERYTYFE